MTCQDYSPTRVLGFTLALLLSPGLSLAQATPGAKGIEKHLEISKMEHLDPRLPQETRDLHPGTIDIASKPISQGCTSQEIAQAIASFKDPWQRQINARYLIDCGSAAVPALVQTLRTSPDATVREWAIISLGWIGDSTAIPALITRLQTDSVPLVRRTAADALGEMRASAAAPALVATLEQPNEDVTVRKAAAEALGRIGGEVTIQSLTRILGNPQEDLNLRNEAVRALIVIGDPALPALNRAMNSPDLRTRYWAVLALAEIQSPSALAALKAQQGKVDRILESAYQADIVEFERVPPSRVRAVARRPIICRNSWVAARWGRCQ